MGFKKLYWIEYFRNSEEHHLNDFHFPAYWYDQPKIHSPPYLLAFHFTSKCLISKREKKKIQSMEVFKIIHPFSFSQPIFSTDPKALF